MSAISTLALLLLSAAESPLEAIFFPHFPLKKPKDPRHNLQHSAKS